MQNSKTKLNQRPFELSLLFLRRLKNIPFKKKLRFDEINKIEFLPCMGNQTEFKIKARKSK